MTIRLPQLLRALKSLVIILLTKITVHVRPESVNREKKTFKINYQKLVHILLVYLQAQLFSQNESVQEARQAHLDAESKAIYL